MMTQNPWGYYNQPQMMQQPMMQPMQQMAPQMDQLAQMRARQQPQAAQGAPVWVQGEAGARAYLIAPGANVMLLDSDAPVFYIKSADAGGRPVLRIFDYTERTQPTQDAAQEQPQYVTREEFARLAAELEAMRQTENRQSRRQAAKEDKNGEPAV